MEQYNSPLPHAGSHAKLPPMGTWRVLEHPADLAMEGRGDSPEAAVESLLEGLLVQILGDALPLAEEERTFECEGIDLQECLVSIFNEVLYQVNEKGLALRQPRVTELGERRLSLVARVGHRPPGCAIDQEVKAATYHGLDLAPDPGGTWRIRALFDV